LREKTLIVSSESGGPVASRLAKARWPFSRARDGTAALRRIRHERFGRVVVVSTGNEMDLVETVLNLRDMRPSMPLIIVSDPSNPQRDPALEAIISLSIPELSILTLEEFQRNLKGTEEHGRTRLKQCEILPAPMPVSAMQRRPKRRTS
jgi:hypothetical protein